MAVSIPVSQKVIVQSLMSLESNVIDRPPSAKTKSLEWVSW